MICGVLEKFKVCPELCKSQGNDHTQGTICAQVHDLWLQGTFANLLMGLPLL